MAVRTLIAALCMTLAAHVRCSEFQVVLDDMDTATSPASLNINSHEGSYEPCMRDAHGGQFHHDWATNKGSAEFGYTFNPPATGCYSLEEYHPGNDGLCARYMPRNAVLDVDYCKGLSTSLSVNQAVKPAQWNEIGAFMFYKGVQGKLTMRNSNDENCDEGQGACFFMADAFRLTRIGDRCPRAGDQNIETLLMTVGSDGQSDVMSLMSGQRTVLETTLALHLGYNSVSVIGMVQTARRLGGGANPGPIQATNLKIRFTADGTSSAQAGNLQEMLDAALQPAGLDVMSASLAPTPLLGSGGPETRNRGEGNSDSPGLCALFYACVGVSVLLAFAGMSCSYAKWKRARTPAETAAVETKGIGSDTVDVEIAKAIEDDAPVKSTFHDDKKENLSDNASGASTGEPASDADSNGSESLAKDTSAEGATIAPQVNIEV